MNRHLWTRCLRIIFKHVSTCSHLSPSLKLLSDKEREILCHHRIRMTDIMEWVCNGFVKKLQKNCTQTWGKIKTDFGEDSMSCTHKWNMAARVMNQDIIIIIIIIIWIGVQFRSLPPGSIAASVAYCTIPRFLNVPTLAVRSTTHSSPLAARGGTMGKKWWPNGAWDMHPGFFYMPQICGMGLIILLPFRRKTCWGF